MIYYITSGKIKKENKKGDEFTYNSHFLQESYIYRQYINNHKHPLFFKSYSVKKYKKTGQLFIFYDYSKF